jgi:peptidoglycan/xylan/chitin deacetylase (PgdA/CDA1 family)
MGGLLAVLVLCALLVTGGGRARPQPVLHADPTGFFGRVRTLAGTGSGSLVAAETAAENRAVYRTLSYTPWVRVAGSEHREVAPTFDDGPGPYTPEILAILARDHVPATFFQVGLELQWFHRSTTEISKLGDAIGDHTFSHPPMSRLTPAEQQAQLLDTAGGLMRYGAPFPHLFRPPYGLWNKATLGLLHRYRMLMVLWTVDTSDYVRPGVRAIVRAAVAGARPGAIILLHDAGGNRSETVQALPQIIAALRRRGYTFVTVPRLLLDNPPSPNQDIGAVIGRGG